MLKNEKEWDYTQQAKYYALRPNYAPKAIDELCVYVQAKKEPSYSVADVGAGTGNLTIMLLERGLHCVAIEPNGAMREIGMQRIKGQAVEWKIGTGEHTTLADSSVDLFVMGSSFNTTDRLQTLREARRVLKPGGYFTCMWNHRDLENDPVQKRMEEIITAIIPGYDRGVRREGQADFILASGLFNDIHYIETAQDVQRTLEEYIEAWKSVKNKYWDLETEAGKAIFNTIVQAFRKEFGSLGKLNLVYITRIWTARVKNN